MTATALELRSPNWRSFPVTAPSAGYTAGQMVKIEDIVGVIVETKTVGLDTALIYFAEKIVVPKVAAIGITFTKGDKVYFSASDAAVTSTASSNTLCGRALEDADADDDEVEIELNGSLPA